MTTKAAPSESNAIAIAKPSHWVLQSFQYTKTKKADDAMERPSSAPTPSAIGTRRGCARASVSSGGSRDRSVDGTRPRSRADPADEQQHRAQPDDQCGRAFGGRPAMEQAPPSRVVLVLQLVRPRDHVVELSVVEGRAAEGRHLPGTDPDGRSDLQRRGGHYRRHLARRDDGARTRPGVAGRAVERVQLESFDHVARAHRG